MMCSFLRCVASPHHRAACRVILRKRFNWFFSVARLSKIYWDTGTTSTNSLASPRRPFDL
eukprot:4777216-Prymnesium_polylepis.1